MKKLHWLAVAEGLKTGNHGKRSYTIWVSCGCFTLQIDRRRFTMLWCQEKIKIIAAMYREARRRAQSLIHTIKNLDQGLVRKKIEKIPVKITGARGQYTFHVWNEIDWSEMSEIRKEKSERNEFIITILVVNWVWFMERRLVAEEGSLSKKTWLQKINRSWWAPELGPVVDNGYRRKSLLECQETFQMV